MADVIQIAKERRKWLAAEVTKLDEFIKTAEGLLKWHESNGATASDTGNANAVGLSGPATLRTSTSGSTTARPA